uniref:Uncharacterized protein n=1 Tax=Panagrolaimus sp. PS1159 TaxID=55785 RepID=A0AC35FYT3_9BILA
MPELIPDVFENIVAEFRYKANTVKNGLADIYNNKNKHCFVYCFKLLKPLLKVLLQSNGRLEIHHSLQGHDQNLVFETLLEAGLKSVVLSAKLCPKYFDMLKTQSSLKSVYADYNFHCSSLFYDIFAIPAASHSIDNCTGDIKIHDIPEDLFFPEVKDLTMYWRDLTNITAEDFSRLSLQIVLNYPNLKNIYFAFQILYCEQHIQNSVVALQSNAFEFIPDHIHGNIVINSRMKGEEYKNMLHQLTNDPDFQYDSEKRVFKKTQLIHDRLCIVFKIEICLPSFMTS